MPAPKTILTNTGRARITNAITLGAALSITQMRLGSSEITPDAAMNAVPDPVWTGNLVSLAVDPEDATLLVARANVPVAAGTWTVRSAGLLDSDGNLIAIGSLAATEKVANYVAMTVTMVIAMSQEEAAAINLVAAGPYISAAEKGVASGVATLDGNGKVPASQLPSYVDDVLEFANLAAFPAVGEAGKIYLDLDTEKTYRWSGSTYVMVSGGSEPGGGSGGLRADKWDLAASTDLPEDAEPGAMYELSTGGVRDGQRFVAGDIALVNVDGTTVVNITQRTVQSSTNSYATLDSASDLTGTLSNGNKTVTGTSAFTTAAASVVATPVKSQVEYTINQLGDGQIFFGVAADAAALPTALASGNLDGLAVVYAGASTWVCYLLEAGSSPVPTPIADPALLPPGVDDVYTVGYDRATRTLAFKQNGTAITLPVDTVPGDEAMTHCTGAMSGSAGVPHQVTAAFGPTFQHPFATYSGVYETVSVFNGPLRIVDRNWTPSGGYPAPADLMPGDLYLSRVAGTVPDDGESYFMGEGTYWDGVAWHHLNDSPLGLDTMIWGGELIPAQSLLSDAVKPLPAPTADMEGHIYRVASAAFATYEGFDGADLPAFFPANCLVAVKDGQYQVVAYDNSDWSAAFAHEFPIQELTTVTSSASALWHAVMGDGELPMQTASFGGYFEHQIIYAPGYAGVKNKLGIALLWAPGANGNTSTWNASDVEAISQYGQVFFYYDFDTKKVICGWGDGVTPGGTLTELADLTADPLTAGEVLGFVVSRNGLWAHTHVDVYRNGENLAQQDLFTLTGIDLAAGTHYYGFSPFFYTDGGTSNRARFITNTGRRPFRYIVETTDQYLYLVGHKKTVNVRTVNGVEPNAAGALTLPGVMLLLSKLQPANADGINGCYALDVERGRLYGPKAGGSWGGTDLCQLIKPAVAGTQVDPYTVESGAYYVTGFGTVAFDVATATGRRQFGIKVHSGISASVDSCFGIGSGTAGSNTVIAQIRRSSGGAWVYFAGDAGQTGLTGEECAGFVAGEEWAFVVDFDTATIEIYTPTGAKLTRAAVPYAGTALTPFVMGNGLTPIRYELQPEGNSASPELYDGEGWVVTPAPYRQVNEPAPGMDEIVNVNDDYRARVQDAVVKIDCTVHYQVVTLPLKPKHKHRVTVIKTDATAFYPTIHGNGRNVNGAASIDVDGVQWASLTVQYDAQTDDWVTV